MSSLAAKYHTINFNSMSFPFLENLLRFTRVHSPVLERREIGDDLVYHFNNDTKILVEFLQKYNRIKFLKTAGYQDKTYWFYDELIEKYFGLGIESQKGNCQLIFRFFEDHLTIKQNDIISLFFNDNTGLSFIIKNSPKKKNKYNVCFYQCNLRLNEVDLKKLSTQTVVGWCHFQPGKPIKRSPFESEDQSVLQYIFQCFRECM